MYAHPASDNQPPSYDALRMVGEAQAELVAWYRDRPPVALTPRRDELLGYIAALEQAVGEQRRREIAAARPPLSTRL